MIKLFIVVIIEGLWIFYNFFTMLYSNLPYVSIFDSEFFIVQLFTSFALRWSPIVGVFLVLVGLLGLIFGKKSTNNLENVKLPALIFGSVYSLILIL